ncbi:MULTISPECIES: cobalamin biosynthesis protein [Pseudomonas]|uniref:Cobalamin biosynthesis protein CobE n=1 Tax=Pseudomonas parafulva TaxID=157782 RepID=A0ABM6J2K8_9PSED|nr:MULTISPECIES: cobalamin biosynthesis protein [Pseudomonas]AQW68652.1 cobalamin biosynthesis protein CobE [Pseudomonas parafulva]MBF8680944.1 cobalamin biosynthesis protein [Pseudomonas fulva]MBF8694564.1 cobalamin biosynthesis protein [Pseudomonas fulva]MBF8719621.1 cobalamin biosynthesis protein [Pseudomonas fulva]MBF8785895.1 cobalamin biosynthesis protein [Pseudomonas fulva]
MKPFYVGFGCRRGCPMDSLLTLLEQGLAQRGLDPAHLHGIASIDLKAHEPGLHALASHLALPLVFYPAPHLNRFETHLSHRSAVAYAHSGCWGVAESAALAMADQYNGDPQLLVTRRTLGPATLAIAH